MWYLYALRCNDGSFYTGITTDVQRRLKEHQSGQGARYTRAHLPVTLVAAWRYPNRSTATRVEYQFKQLSHKAKSAWIEGRWSFMGGPFADDAFEEPTLLLEARFCPRCGGRLETEHIDGEMIQVCTLCGRHHYRNAKPAAGILIVRDDAVLLVRRNRAPFSGFWDIPGGFLHPEELPRAGALREVQEETGLRGAQLSFLGFYIDHYEFQGERHTILNIYFVGEGAGEPHAGDDADEIAWFPLDGLPENIAFEHAPQVLADVRRWVERCSADADCF